LKFTQGIEASVPKNLLFVNEHFPSLMFLNQSDLSMSAAPLPLVLSERSNSSKINEDQLHSFIFSRLPVWLFSISEGKVLWANSPALELWEAESLEELHQRDMGADMTSSVQNRLLQYQRGFNDCAVFNETWTIYPKGKPKTVVCRYQGCQMHNGNTEMLCEGQIVGSESHATVRGAQALLYTTAMVTIYNQQLECIYANSAALNAFSQSELDLRKRIKDPTVLKALSKRHPLLPEGQITSDVETTSGNRIHEIDVRRSRDPITGQETTILTEVDVTEELEAKKHAETLASEDFLTGLLNRYYFQAHADEFIKENLNKGEYIYLLLFDLDRFKLVNDALGHLIGDELLKETAKKLTKFFGEQPIIGRFGGDEFCVLASSAMNPKQFEHVCELFLTTLKAPMFIQRHSLRVDASIGFSFAKYGEGIVCFDDLLMKADLALYAAKKGGRDGVQKFIPKLQIRRERSLHIEEELTHALQRSSGALHLHFQPIYDTVAGKPMGLEALCRLTTKEGEQISPTEFISIAESTTLMIDLGLWVLDSAISNLAEIGGFDPSLKLSINISPTQFLTSELLSNLKEYAARSDFDPRLIELELTETEAAIGETQFVEVLEELVDIGYFLAIDDFGIAYSNIHRLNSIPFSTIKMDRSIISHSNESLASGVIQIGKAMGLNVVAEGIETEQQSKLVAKLGCTRQQGY
jgi:diguanylate cyclase (GGDEF)-like protein